MRTVGFALVLFAAAPVAAQDRARLDDFALPGSEQSVTIDQLPSAGPLPAEQSRDRSLAVPQPAAQPRAPLEQLAGPDDEATPPNQLTDGEASRRIVPAGVSSAADSKPAPAGPIGGADRCDPRAIEDESRAECLRILELRAAEFQATEAPQLSAEQKLLAEQRREDDRFAPSHALRLRLASSNDPDAGLPTNQEIAALYLERDDAAASRRPGEAPAESDVLTDDLIQALQAVLPGATQP